MHKAAMSKAGEVTLFEPNENIQNLFCELQVGLPARVGLSLKWSAGHKHQAAQRRVKCIYR